MGDHSNIRVGIVGSGFMSRGLVATLQRKDGVSISKVLTRSDPDSRPDFPPLLTNSMQELVDTSDVIVECCGDVVYATDVCEKILKAGLPILTLDPALHITTGSYLSTLGYFSEAHGDQPGCLAEFAKDITLYGFTPVIYGNNKGFLNLDPTPNEMAHWGKRLGISQKEVISNTDGTKVQIEQALVANYFGADITDRGMLGIRCDTLKQGAFSLTGWVEQLGPIADFIIPKDHVPGVFIVAKCNDISQQPYLKYLKMGDGPYYLFSTNFHLCHLEVIKTLRMALNGQMLVDNSSTPAISVAAISKRVILKGEKVGGAGSFDIRGKAIRTLSAPAHVPIGLIQNAIAKRKISRGDMLTFDHVVIPDSLALRSWCEYHVRR